MEREAEVKDISMPPAIKNTKDTSIDENTQIGGASNSEVFHARRIAFIATGHAVHDTYSSFLPPLLPVLIERLSLSTMAAGLLSVFMQLPSLLQPIIGHLSDRINLRFIVIVAPAVTATLMSLLGVAPGYPLIAVLLIIVGVSSASFHAVSPAITSALSGKKLGRGMSFWMVGGEIGRALGPVLLVSAFVYLTIAGMPWLMVGGWLASLLLYKQLKDIQVHSSNLGERLPWRLALSGMRSIMLPLAGIILVRSFILSSLTIYLPIFLTKEGADLWFAGASLSVMEVAGIVGTLLGGIISDRLGRRFVMLFSMMASPFLMFLFLSISGWVRFPVLLALGFSLLSINPVLLAVVQENFPKNRALANGLYLGMSFIIRSGAVLLLGVLGDLFGLRLGFTASIAIILLGLPLIFLLPIGIAVPYED